MLTREKFQSELLFVTELIVPELNTSFCKYMTVGYAYRTQVNFNLVRIDIT